MVKVWAPLARQVELVCQEARHRLAPSQRGWWSADFELPHGADYQFSVNGEYYPDPRSPWQPHGVHGPSRHYDHRRFAWQCDEWPVTPLRSAVIYELHVGTFTKEGTFAAAIERLDHLVDLGITHIELMPVIEFLGERGWGYDGVFPFAPHHHYGGPDGLKTLVDAAHSRGLAVLLDVVHNHLGPSGNYLPQFAPVFTTRYVTPWGQALNFDGPDSDGVRDFFISSARMWLRDYRFDGLRLDAVHAILDHSAVHFLEELATEVASLSKELGRELVLIGESDLNDPRLIRPSELGGYGLHAQWSDDVHHAIHSVLTGERTGYYEDFGGLAQLAAALVSPYVYAGDYSPFRKRKHGRPPRGLSPDHFLSYLQNHDQIGNRAKGERISHLVSYDLTKVGAALVLLSPYVPLVFQGEEWAASSPFQFFVDFASEPDLAANVLKGRRREFAAFGWNESEVPNPNDPATFARSQLKWDELQQSPHRDMLDWYRSLIALRRTPRFLASSVAPANVQLCEDKNWLVVERGDLIIACNFSDQPQRIPLPGADKQRVLLSSRSPIATCSDFIELPPESVAIQTK